MIYTNFQWTVLCLAALCGAGLGQTCSSCSCSTVCCLQVPENSSPGTSIGFTTTHPDLQGTAGNGAVFTASGDNFVIDPSTGEIFVAENATLDADSEANCIIVAVGIEDGATGLLGIDILDMNDQAPMFSGNGPIEISIVETTSANSAINCMSQRSTLNMLTATDGDRGIDNSRISYSISDSSIFSISNPTASPPCLVNNGELDRDRLDYEPYEFTLVATDSGTPAQSSSVTVMLSLKGENEFPPSFPPEMNNNYEYDVLENRTIGFEVYQFTVQDDDAFDEQQIFNYEITFGVNNDCPFSINATTGSLTLSGAVDAETITLCSLTIRVTDMQGMYASIGTTVSVADVNEPATIMTQSIITVYENEISTDVVFSVLDSDRDFRNNTVELISGNEYFETSPVVPSIYRIQQIKSLDRENLPEEEGIVVRLIEEGEPTFSNQLIFTLVVLDRNDNQPFLNISSIDIPEEQGFNRILLGDYVVDIDEGINAEVREIELIQAAGSNDITDRFIEQNGNLLGSEGALTVPPHLDREVDGPVITIRVNITDNGSPPQSRVSIFTLMILDINDNAPLFQPQKYIFNVSENDQPKVIGTVRATDLDNLENGTVTYLLNSNNFEIDSETGQIRSLVVFDREDIGEYMLIVNAKDNSVEPMSATVGAMVTIIIEDVDDNPPLFVNPEMETFQVAVDSAVGTIVGTVEATDEDSGVNAEIIFSLTDTNSVSINSTTGVITVEEVPMDVTSYNLTVTASPRNDDHESVSKQVLIKISVASLLPELTIIIIGAVSALVVGVALVFCLVLACCCAQRRRGKYSIENPKTDLNNQPKRINSLAKPILKSVPAAMANGNAGNRERVQVKFSDRVDETHYDRQGAVLGDKVLRKASITNFGSSDESPQVPSRGSPVHNGVLPSGIVPVMDYEHSPGPLMNGMTSDLPGLQQRYEMHHIPQHSPLHLRQTIPDHHTDFSQGTSSTTDVNSYNSDGEEEESTFSDGASNMNTSIPCFKDEHVSDLHRYGPPPSHPPHYLHHSPHIPSPNGLLGVIHPGNMSSLAAEGSYRSSQGNGYTNRHSQNHHSLSDSSSQSTTPSPHPRHEILNRMEPPSMRAKHPLTNGHSYPRQPPLVMPDAYPIGGLPDIHHRDVVHHRHTNELSLSDFGEASTYASTELDEALNINYELEPGFYSLTATDYGDQDDS